MRKEKETEMRKRVVGWIKKQFYFLQSSYSELLLITDRCSSMLKFLGFSIFDVDVFLSFEALKMLKKKKKNHLAFLVPLIRMLL